VIEVQPGLIVQTVNVPVKDRLRNIKDWSGTRMTKEDGPTEYVPAGSRVAGPSVHELRGVLFPHELLQPTLPIPTAGSEADTPLAVALVGCGILADEGPILTDLHRKTAHERGGCDHGNHAPRHQTFHPREPHGLKLILPAADYRLISVVFLPGYFYNKATEEDLASFTRNVNDMADGRRVPASVLLGGLTPNLLNRICAYPEIISCVLGACILDAGMMYSLSNQVGLSAVAANWRAGAWLLLALIPNSLLGCFLGMVTCWPLARRLCSRLNGAPLRVGDRVLILSGPQKGDVADVGEITRGQGGWNLAVLNLRSDTARLPAIFEEYSLLKIAPGSCSEKPGTRTEVRTNDSR
jgi:hypothetical protein